MILLYGCAVLRIVGDISLSRIRCSVSSITQKAKALRTIQQHLGHSISEGIVGVGGTRRKSPGAVKRESVSACSPQLAREASQQQRQRGARERRTSQAGPKAGRRGPA